MNARCTSRRSAAGFTLFESIIAISVLALAAAGILAMMPQVFRAQNELRNEATGVVLMQACAERLLGTRRQVGYSGVNTGLCSTLTVTGSGFNAPQVVLRDASNTVITGSPPACSSATTTCTATITIARSSGPATSLPALTLRLYSN